jgi:hypothetical protein
MFILLFMPYLLNVLSIGMGVVLRYESLVDMSED